MWKNTVEPIRPRVTIWRLRIPYWIPEATDTYSECVIGLCIAFPLQQWLHDRTSTDVIRKVQSVFVLVKVDRALLVGFVCLKHKV